MKLFRIVLTCFLAGLMGLLIFACKGTGEKKTKLAFVTNNASDFWTIARKGVEQADKELPNVDVEFRIPADGTAAEQRRIVDDLLGKVDARNAQERYQGIKDALQGSKVEIIDVRTDDTDRVRAKSNASDTLV